MITIKREDAMKKQQRISILMTAAVTMIFIGCGKKATEPPDTTPTRNVILRDSAFTTMDPFINFPFKLNPNSEITGLMSLDSTIGRIYKGSIVSDSNNSAMLNVFTSINDFQDTMAGIEFYIRAAASCNTNFIVFLGKENGSYKNTKYFFGMGFDKSDSIKYVSGADSMSSTDAIFSADSTKYRAKNIAPIQLNRWYKCNAELTFADTTVTYYLDNVKVGQVKWHFTIIQAISIDMYVVYRNGSGASGPASYYLNDVTIYKK